MYLLVVFNFQFHLFSVTKCQLLAKEANGGRIIVNGITVLPLGKFVPKCKEDGSFELVQCHPSTGYCWCVDENGGEVTFTKTRQGKPECSRSKF